MSRSTTDVMADTAAAAAAAGDADAFATLCRLLQEDVWRYCCAVLGDEALAEEAAQETFLRAVSAIRRFRGACPARVYLLVLARRSCAAALRRESREGRHDRLDAAREPTVGGHGAAIETSLLLNMLPLELRQAFVLTQVIGLPYDDAARICDCPVGTIRSRVYRARERLITALTHQDEQRDAR